MLLFRSMAPTMYFAVFVPMSVAAASVPDPARNTLDEIVVTGVRDTGILYTPKNVTIITEEDITLAPSSNIIDLLSQETSITFRSFTGNDKFGGVDIRGMGDTYTSNVLVLVDGIKLNAADLSGADFSSISINEISRIEIIRSGGAVRYGSGAVGGVINIITKTPGDDISTIVRTWNASENTHSNSVELSGSAGNFSGRLKASEFETLGYRDNGDLDKQDINLSLDYKLSPSLNTGLILKYHHDEYGLPGPISENAFESGEESQLRATNSPFDSGETNDTRIQWNVAQQLGVGQSIHFHTHFRNRSNPYLIGLGEIEPVFRPPGDEIKENTNGVSFEYEKLAAFGFETLNLNLGIEYSASDYERQDNVARTVDASTNYAGKLKQHGAFAALEHLITPNLKLDVGYRYDKTNIDQRQSRPLSEYETTFVEETIIITQIENVDIGGGVIVPIEIDVPVVVQLPVQEKVGETTETVVIADDFWRNDAVEIGATYNFSDNHTAFISFMRGYRNPNIDELLLTPEPAGAGSSLIPQSSTHWDIGYKWKGDSTSFAVSVFVINIDDEILFGQDPRTRLNVNFNALEQTRRAGIEIESRWSVTEDYALKYNASFMRARFQESDLHIPLVPEVSGSIGMEWRPLQNTYLSLNADYVGERYDGNAFGPSQNDSQMIDSYTTVDFKLIQDWRGARISAGINNLFDEVYASSVYSGSYYPGAGKNIYTSLSYEFD